jgi:hypothetical protein
MGMPEGLLPPFNRSKPTAERLRDLVVSHAKLADVKEKLDQPAEALGHWQQARAYLLKIEETGGKQADWANQLAFVEQQIERLQG